MGKIIQNILKREAYKKKLTQLEKEIYLDQAKEVDLLVQTGLSYIAALREVKEMYEKAHSLTDQDKENEHEKIFNDIISDTEDVDNGEVYDINTGESTNGFYELLEALNKIVKQMKIYDIENKDFCISSISYCSDEDKIHVNFEEDK